jgi:alkanesulfonate monooxygenase SsuD/methylene tetrahydromethanopterin reductase-like flavin-dependent oxidoreductase (luciferase family)
MGQPDRPALAPIPVLGTLAAVTSRVALGTLVARVGLVPAEVLIGELATLDAVAPGRVVAGIGTGDHLSEAENLAYGIEFAPAAERLAELRHCAAVLAARGVTVWVGGRGPATLAIARDLGVAANLWDAGLEEVADKARQCEVTWAGPVPKAADGDATAAELRERLARLRDAGASWAVFSYPVSLELLAAEVAEGSTRVPPDGL